MSPTSLTTTAIALALGLVTAQAAAQDAVPATAYVQSQDVAAVPALPLVTPSGDLIETIKAAGQFTTFLIGTDSTNLTGLLKTNTNLTVFVPTDAAFAAVPPAELSTLMANKTALQKFILHHIVNAQIQSAQISGVKGPVPSGAGDQILLDGTAKDGTLMVDGATILQADIKTDSGLLQIVDKVLIAGQGEPTPVPGADGEASAAEGALAE